MRPCVPERGRRIALYPGAFRPAHKVHLAAIFGLVARPDVDEVVVIIANRCRTLPGTTLVLDAGVALEVLLICVRGVAKVRVEVAPHNAVTHALGYLEHAKAGDTLLYCVGEADLGSGDDRFENLLSANIRTDVTARVLALPTGAGTVRATALREALTAGEARRDEFMAALPEHLGDEQRMRVWSICRKGLRELDHIVEARLRTLLDPALVGHAPRLRCVVPGKLDPVFCVQRADGSKLYVKYAGETAEAGCVGQRYVPKPRRRLSCERRAIRCLRAQLTEGFVALAEILAFDKALSLQVQSEVCAGGRSLQDELRAGRFDMRIAAQVGRFLAACHAIRAADVPPLWGEAETDLRHWHAMLDLRTLSIAAPPQAFTQASPQLTPQLFNDLQRLRTASGAARRKGFFVLDVAAKNILVPGAMAGMAGIAGIVGTGATIGVIDLELCSSQGDPAYDLGMLLGHYLLWGLCTGPATACMAALRSVLDAYREGTDADAWFSMRARVAAFAGAAMLDVLVRERRMDVQAFEPQIVAAAASLLAALP